MAGYIRRIQGGTMKSFWICSALLAVAFFPAGAQQSSAEPPAAETPPAVETSPAASWREEVVLHGFGSWIYGRSGNENVYLDANREGNYRAAGFELNLSADIS